MFTFAWWLNLATFAGIAILAVPVWSLNSRKRKLHQVRQADQSAEDDSDFRSKTRKILKDMHEKDVAGWRWRDHFCLLVGYVLLLGSAFLRVLFPTG
ncbi:hypothetical protein [Puniceibacterium sediminis]|uniref:Uncharacterized protein n=1 Tax=Puniceibacterium sediminis TaxID=1608407 RepID=A0A238WCY6_9RHOB|nr:hypothetical protein [Puniceibacterium sediminis]SNR44446.1 hypothetical protein SAMN06265370_105117 [Puniceibacterium sediminis]